MDSIGGGNHKLFVEYAIRRRSAHGGCGNLQWMLGLIIAVGGLDGWDPMDEIVVVRCETCYW